MVQKIAPTTSMSVESLIQDCAATLERVASYRLPAAMDRRLLLLSESQEGLTEAEREEMLALIDFSEDRTVEKLQAKVILNRLEEAWPGLIGSRP